LKNILGISQSPYFLAEVFGSADLETALSFGSQPIFSSALLPTSLASLPDLLGKLLS
jgi:hypothetical protein